MVEGFDPYYKWLGISPKNQPPNHYRLLGIDLFEADREVISAAAERQMAHLQSYKLGPHADLSQQLLSEVAAARICLLNAEKKAVYDDTLRSQGWSGRALAVASPLLAPSTLSLIRNSPDMEPSAAENELLLSSQSLAPSAPLLAARKDRVIVEKRKTLLRVAMVLTAGLVAFFAYKVTERQSGEGLRNAPAETANASESTRRQGQKALTEVGKAGGTARSSREMVETSSRASGDAAAVAGLVDPAASKLLRGAVAWYRAEGNANDSAGNHHGKLEGGAVITPIGDGHAFEFDGKTGSLVVPDAPELNLSKHFTVMAWVNRRSEDWSLVVAKLSALGQQGQGYEGYTLGIGKVRFVAYLTGSGERYGTNEVWQGPAGFPVNEWLHITASYDGRNFQLYRNARPIGGFPIGDKAAATTGGPLVIGSDGYNRAHFHGLIDDAALFDRALTGSEIETIYRGTLDGKIGQEEQELYGLSNVPQAEIMETPSPASAGSASPDAAAVAGLVDPAASKLLRDAVAWYRAEENAKDSAGNHHGQLEGGAVITPIGVGHAFEFDGGHGSIVVGDAPELNPSNEFTVIAWICPHAAGKTKNVIISKIGKGSGGDGYEFGLAPDNKHSLFLSFNSPGKPRGENGLFWLPRPIAAGEWAHVAGNYDGEVLRIFLNGVHISTWNCGSGCGGKIVASSRANFRISGTDDGTFGFDGFIDDAALFDRALSASEIETIYRGTLEGKSGRQGPSFDSLSKAHRTLLARYANTGTVDVLALIDPARDAIKGKWIKDASGLHSPRDTRYATLRLPVDVPEEYCLTLVAERADGWKGILPSLVAGLVGGKTQFNAIIDWKESTGLEVLDGRAAVENESTVSGGTLFDDGRLSVVTYIVRKGAVEIEFDGRRILAWRGNFSRLRPDPGWRKLFASPSQLFLATHCDYRFGAIFLTPLAEAVPDVSKESAGAP